MFARYVPSIHDEEKRKVLRLGLLCSAKNLRKRSLNFNLDFKNTYVPELKTMYLSIESNRRDGLGFVDPDPYRLPATSNVKLVICLEF